MPKATKGSTASTASTVSTASTPKRQSNIKFPYHLGTWVAFECHEAVQALAKADRRTVSDWVRTAIEMRVVHELRIREAEMRQYQINREQQLQRQQHPLEGATHGS
jgi:hypothetical protein